MVLFFTVSPFFFFVGARIAAATPVSLETVSSFFSLDADDPILRSPPMGSSGLFLGP